MNIGVGSCIIAIVLYITNLPVPLILEDTATFTGAITGPLSMLVIGDSLAQTRLRDLFTDVRLLVFSVVKLVLLPALLLWGLCFFIKDPIFRGVCLVMMATPVGSMTVMLAQQYNGDYRLTSRGRGFDHIAFRDHNAVFVLGAEAIATNFLSVVLF